MAPTEILARQHAETLAELLRASRVRYTLLVGGLTAKQRETALAEIAAGKIDLVIGTHAVVQEDVRFAKLGLVIIDEQHKFGVRQRAALRQGEKSPHYLVMTATPIPRTVSMTLFGDLDVTTLREMPPGRQEVRTYVVDAGRAAAVVEFCAREAASRAAGVRRRAAGRRIGEHRGGQRVGSVRAADQRRAGRVSRRDHSWPDVAGGEGRGDGEFSLRPNARARFDERD